MKKIYQLSIICFVFLFLVGCSAGVLPHGSGTTTDLTKNNFRVLRANAVGKDSGFYLFGIIPFYSPTYSDAMRDLYKGVRVEGKATALANVSQDKSYLYLVLFSIPKITVTADIIEFTD